MRALWVWLLLILAVPLAAEAVTAPIEMGAETRTNLFLGLGAGCFVLGFGTAAIFGIRNDRLRKKSAVVSEKIQQRDNVISALWLASIIDAIALFVAGASIAIALLITGIAMLWTLAWLPSWMRRLSAETGVVIRRDQTTVFEFLADKTNEPAYIPEIESVQKITDGPIGKGTQFRARMSISRGVFEAIDEITDFEPTTLIKSSVVSGLRPNLDVLRLDAVPEGTRVTHHFDTELPYASALLIQGLVRPLMVAGLKSRRNAAWARLKQLLESQGA